MSRMRLIGMLVIAVILSACSTPITAEQQQATVSSSVAMALTAQPTSPVVVVTRLMTKIVVVTATPTSTPDVSPTPKPTATPRFGSIGVARQSAGVVLTILSSTYTSSIDQFTKAESGQVYLVVEVLIENRGSEKVSYNPFYFKVKDDLGYEYNSSLLSPNPSLNSGDLNSGDKVRGYLAFKVKQGAGSIILSYDPSVFGDFTPIEIDVTPK